VGEDGVTGTRRLSCTLLGSILVAVAIALSGCGGGKGNGAAEDGSSFGTNPGETSTADTGSVELDPSTLPPPGHARVEVDSQVYMPAASGSIHFDCEVGADEIRVNFQQTDEGDLTFQARVLNGAWLGNVTFVNGDNNYGGSLTDGGQELTIGTSAVTYTGSMTHRTYSDPTDTREVEAVVAVNCDTSGAGDEGEAMAEIDGRTYTFPASGAQSYECEVAPTAFRVTINRLAPESEQIQLEGTQKSGEWLANVYVISGTDRFNAIIPADGAGLEINGTMLTFSGTFTQTSETDPTVEDEVDGSASVTCP
jgi:hypothetical protein